MKKFLLKATTFAFISLLVVNSANSQIFFTQNFEGTMGANGIPTGWTETGLSTDGIYIVGNNVLSNAAGFWPVPAHTLFAQTNDDVCNCDKSIDRLILPAQNFSAIAGGVQLIADFYMDGLYSSTGFIEVSTNGGTTWTSIYTMTASTAWQNNTVISLNAYVGLTNVLIAFRFNDQAQWATGLAVDNVRLNETPPAAGLNITNSFEQYTEIPLLQTTSMVLSAQVTNTGTLSLTDASLTANVYLAPDFITPVFSASSTPATLAAGASATYTAGNYTPTVVGAYVFEYISTSSTATNDTLTASFSVTANEYARDNGNVVINLGVGPTSIGIVGSNYTIVNNTIIDSVMFFITPGQANPGDTVQVLIGTVAANVPTGTYIGSSAPYILTAADTTASGALLYLPITNTTGNPLQLTAGNYFVGIKEFLTTANYGLACTDGILTPNTVYASINNGPYSQLSALGFDNVPVIRPSFSCVPLSATDVQSTCSAYTWIDGNTYTTSNNTATYVVANPGACDTVYTLNLTVTPITATDVISACNTYTWIDGNTYTADNNTATFTSTTGTCDTLITLNLTINTIDLTVSASGATLTSNQATGTYQWIDCATNSSISGATSQAYTATVTGDYAVIVTTPCGSDTSSCQTVTVADLNETGIIVGLNPNPTNDKIIISFNAINALLTVRDAQGKVVIVGENIVSSEIIDLQSVETGIYFFHLVINGQESVYRVMKN